MLACQDTLSLATVSLPLLLSRLFRCFSVNLQQKIGLSIDAAFVQIGHWDFGRLFSEHLSLT